jgi:phosphatidylglycerol:prolipoprotein diacylglycerol transferase
MHGHFIHRIDPIICRVAGFYLWFYGLSYSLGFLSVYFWFKRRRRRLGLSLSDVYSLSICFAAGLLIGGRLIEVIFYEWPYYRNHPSQITSFWLGGMSTHGVLLGAVAGIWVFCWSSGKRFLTIAEELALPGIYLMAMGRIGNFIDGQIVGRVTDVWWAVQFPDAPGFRHPVVLYDGAKNFFVLGLLLIIGRTNPPPGILGAHFIFWYGFLRIFVDVFREYPTTLLGLATGQALNIFMAALGGFLFFWFSRKKRNQRNDSASDVTPVSESTHQGSLWAKRIAFALLILFALVLPSDWTQDVPERYGKRHAGMQHSSVYPDIEGNIPK